MNRETFVFYSSIYEASLHLTKEERGEFLEVIIEYSLKGKLSEMPKGTVRAMFESCKVNIDKQITNYKNGAKPKRNRSETEAKPKRTANYKEKEKEKEKDINKKIKQKKELDTYPDNLNIKAFEDWLAYKGSNYSRQGKTLSMNKLTKFDPITQREMVDNSIMNNYKGLFEIKKQNNGQTKSNNKTYDTIDKFFNQQQTQGEIIDARID